MRLLTLFLIGLLTISCIREEVYEGQVDVSGYCYNPCTDKALANMHVRFNHDEINFETFTDSNGYFEIKQSYSFVYLTKSGPDIGGISIRDEQFDYSDCRQYNHYLIDSLQIDTIFFYQVVNSIFKVKVDSSISSTQEDTIFLRLNSEDCLGPERPVYRASHSSERGIYRIGYNEYYVGPFEDNQILDTLKTYVDARTIKSLTNEYPSTYYLSGPNIGNRGFRVAFYSPSTSGNDTECNSLQSVEIDLNN